MSIDTPPPHDATPSAVPDHYAALVTDAQNMRGALDAIAKMDKLRVQLGAAQARRDEYVGKLHVDDGLRPPEIARRTGMSISNVRLICDKARLLHKTRGTDAGSTKESAPRETMT